MARRRRGTLMAPLSLRRGAPVCFVIYAKLLHGDASSAPSSLRSTCAGPIMPPAPLADWGSRTTRRFARETREERRGGTVERGKGARGSRPGRAGDPGGERPGRRRRRVLVPDPGGPGPCSTVRPPRRHEPRPRPPPPRLPPARERWRSPAASRGPRSSWTGRASAPRRSGSSSGPAPTACGWRRRASRPSSARCTSSPVAPSISRRRSRPEAPRLSVTADVPGAQVFLDRKFVGEAPLEIPDVEPGQAPPQRVRRRLRGVRRGHPGRAPARTRSRCASRRCASTSRWR